MSDTKFKLNCYSPNLSSPKFPQPIFLPTRKFGPTMSTPDEELTECLAEYMLLVPLCPAPAPVPPPPVPGTPL